MPVNNIKHIPSYLVLIVLVGKLDVDVMLGADLCDDGPLAADDLGMILGVHSDGQLEAPQGLHKANTHFSKTSIVTQYSVNELSLTSQLTNWRASVIGQSDFCKCC